MNKTPYTWDFQDENATFRLKNPQQNNYLYFPLVNEAGMMSAITPTLNGDIKTGQNSFLTLPVSVEDLHNTRSGRNFWVVVEGVPWSAAGNSAEQRAHDFSTCPQEKAVLEAGFLWQRITRSHPGLGLEAQITNFIPVTNDQVEIMLVQLTNCGNIRLHLTPTAAVPIYGRSADDIRDHRHVTSLLNRVTCTPNGVLDHPTLTFDERGHQINRMTYAVLGAEEDGSTPIGFTPTVEDFIGEGGALDWPATVIQNRPPSSQAGDSLDGYEAMGALHFAPLTLKPGESRSYVVLMGIWEEKKGEDTARKLVDRYGSLNLAEKALEENKAWWENKLGNFAVQTGDKTFDGWMRWVAAQPTLRRLFGNSFLPYHDYGRGGRGWRDLWQDILALLLTEEGDVSEMLFGNFAGIRLDGSNATIIGNAPGEFKADRNNIPRVWMDHGAWPLLTTLLYIDQSGDLNFLLREQTYFKDHLTHRTARRDDAWKPEDGTLQKTREGKACSGTILEHLLVQHLVQFFNVGEHNLIRMEGADWNDGLDMAAEKGESSAFTALYAHNLALLSETISRMAEEGIKEVSLAQEVTLLLDSISDSVDYQLPGAKKNLLQKYFDGVEGPVSGTKIAIDIEALAADLKGKADWLVQHIRKQEWVEDKDGRGWFNGYYDNDAQAVEGKTKNGMRMTLTGQVFTLMGWVADQEQAEAIIKAVDLYLVDPAVGGPRLNTDFGEVLLNLGRAFGFAYGHKENGAMFSHMAVMYAYALYQRGFPEEGHKVLEGIYRQSANFEVSRMYPGIPEYFSPRGRGLYTYLTGSASWYLLSLVTEVFGVRGQMGDLSLAPALTADQFDPESQCASLTTLFGGKRIRVTYHNPRNLDAGEYTITRVNLNKTELKDALVTGKALLSRGQIEKASGDVVEILAELG